MGARRHVEIEPHDRQQAAFRPAGTCALGIAAFAFFPRHLLPEVLESGRRQLGVAHRVLDVAVSEVGLQGPSVVPGGDSGESGLVRARLSRHIHELLRLLRFRTRR